MHLSSKFELDILDCNLVGYMYFTVFQGPSTWWTRSSLVISGLRRPPAQIRGFGPPSGTHHSRTENRSSLAIFGLRRPPAQIPGFGPPSETHHSRTENRSSLVIFGLWRPPAQIRGFGPPSGTVIFGLHLPPVGRSLFLKKNTSFHISPFWPIYTCWSVVQQILSYFKLHMMICCVWTWFPWLPLWFVTCYFTLGVFAPFHFISYVFQVFSTATLFNLISWFVMIWVGTWRHNFIMDDEIMKLDVVHWSLNLVFLTATWFDTFNISYLSLPPSLYLIWVAIVLNCNNLILLCYCYLY